MNECLETGWRKVEQRTHRDDEELAIGDFQSGMVPRHPLVSDLAHGGGGKVKSLRHTISDVLRTKEL